MAIEEFPVLHSSWNKDVVIAKYFKDGYTYEEICTFLRLRHGLELTIDQLRYKLKKMGLGRRRAEDYAPLEVVEAAISVSPCCVVSKTVVHVVPQ